MRPKVKVELSREEWWPVYILEKTDEDKSWNWRIVEVEDGLWIRYQIAKASFDKVQQELYDLFGEDD